MLSVHHLALLRVRRGACNVVQEGEPDHCVLLQELFGLFAHARNAEALVDGLDGVLVHKVARLERTLCLRVEGVEHFLLEHGNDVVLSNKHFSLLPLCEELVDARGEVLFERTHDALGQVAAHAAHPCNVGNVGLVIGVGRGALGPNGLYARNGEHSYGILFVEALERPANTVLVCG